MWHMNSLISSECLMYRCGNGSDWNQWITHWIQELRSLSQFFCPYSECMIYEMYQWIFAPYVIVMYESLSCRPVWKDDIAVLFFLKNAQICTWTIPLAILSWKNNESLLDPAQLVTVLSSDLLITVIYSLLITIRREFEYLICTFYIIHYTLLHYTLYSKLTSLFLQLNLTDTNIVFYDVQNKGIY